MHDVFGRLRRSGLALAALAPGWLGRGQGGDVARVMHGHGGHAAGTQIGLDHGEGLFMNAVFLVFAPYLRQQRVHGGAQLVGPGLRVQVNGAGDG